MASYIIGWMFKDIHPIDTVKDGIKNTYSDIKERFHDRKMEKEADKKKIASDESKKKISQIREKYKK